VVKLPFQEELLLQAVTYTHEKKDVSSDVSEIIRSENYQQEISKCSFLYVGYKSVDTLNLSVTKF
jgi:hypothetical protein